MEINSLIQDIQNSCDTLTNFCIGLLTHICHATGISYGELNVFLFLVIYPILLILFILASIVDNKKIKRILIISGFSIIAILILFFFFFMIDATIVAREGLY